jgi:hypothetical protein
MRSEIRSARLAAWATAFLDGRVSLDEATLRIIGNDRGHDITGLPGCDGPVGLTLALGALRRAGVTGLRLVLPVPGDPAGVRGPAALTNDAVAAGEAALTEGGGETYGIVPRIAQCHVVWKVYDAADAPAADLTIGAAERVLTETLLECTDELSALDVAALTPEAAAALERYREEDRRSVGSLPPGHPPRAARVLALADRLTAIADLAAIDDGAAVSSTRADRRRALLAEVATAARQARMAAYNAVLEPSRQG